MLSIYIFNTLIISTGHSLRLCLVGMENLLQRIVRTNVVAVLRSFFICFDVSISEWSELKCLLNDRNTVVHVTSCSVNMDREDMFVSVLILHSS